MNNELDPTREHIVAKLDAKKAATTKLLDSVGGLDGQIDIYDKAIQKTMDKLASQRARKASFEASRQQILDQAEIRQGEIDHMEEILSRYDESTVEGEALGEILNRKQAEDSAEFDAETWVPGATGKVALKDDKEYQEALTRKRYLLDLREACKFDVNKIMVSRGEVSEFNVKGRKGV